MRRFNFPVLVLLIALLPSTSFASCVATAIFARGSQHEFGPSQHFKACILLKNDTLIASNSGELGWNNIKIVSAFDCFFPCVLEASDPTQLLFAKPENSEEFIPNYVAVLARSSVMSTEDLRAYFDDLRKDIEILSINAKGFIQEVTKQMKSPVIQRASNSVTSGANLADNRLYDDDSEDGESEKKYGAAPTDME